MCSSTNLLLQCHGTALGCPPPVSWSCSTTFFKCMQPQSCERAWYLHCSELIRLHPIMLQSASLPATASIAVAACADLHVSFSACLLLSLLSVATSATTAAHALPAIAAAAAAQLLLAGFHVCCRSDCSCKTVVNMQDIPGLMEARWPSILQQSHDGLKCTEFQLWKKSSQPWSTQVFLMRG